MTRTYRLTLMLISLAAAGGCSQKQDGAATDEIRGELIALTMGLDIAEDNIQSLESRVAALESSDDGPVVLTLDSGSVPINVWAGQLLVAWDDIVAFGDGSRVTLRIGNPLQGSMQGVNITAEWDGKVSGSIQTKEPNTLHAGSWNNVRFRIPNVKPDQIETLNIKLVIDNISLMQRD